MADLIRIDEDTLGAYLREVWFEPNLSGRLMEFADAQLPDDVEVVVFNFKDPRKVGTAEINRITIWVRTDPSLSTRGANEILRLPLLENFGRELIKIWEEIISLTDARLDFVTIRPGNDGIPPGFVLNFTDSSEMLDASVSYDPEKNEFLYWGKDIFIKR